MTEVIFRAIYQKLIDILAESTIDSAVATASEGKKEEAVLTII